MTARLVECSDHDVTYGILTVENATASEVQEKIYEIKNSFYEEGNYGWSIDDVLEKLPEEWIWEFDRNESVIEI